MTTDSYNILLMGWIPSPNIIVCCCRMSPTCVFFALLYLSLPLLSSPTFIPKHECPQDVEYTSPPPSISAGRAGSHQENTLWHAEVSSMQPSSSDFPPHHHHLFLLLSLLPHPHSLQYERRFLTLQLIPGKPVTRREQRTRLKECVRPSLDTALVTSHLT